MDFNEQDNNNYDPFSTENLSKAGKEAADIRRQNRERYGIQLTRDEYDVLNKSIANAPDPEEKAYEFGTAMKVSKALNIPFDEAVIKAPQFEQALWGNGDGILVKKSNKEWYKAVSDSFKLGDNSIALGNLGNELMKAEREGRPEVAAEIQKQIDAINQENLTLQDDVPRKWYVDALKFGAESLPFTILTAGMGTVAGIGGAGFGMLASWQTSAGITAGQEYIELREAGADSNTAQFVSTVSGQLQGIVEAALGEVPAFKALGKGSKTAVQKVSGKITDYLFKNMHYSGALKTIASTITHLGLDYTQEVMGEGAEEAVQNLISEGSHYLAKALCDEYQLDEKTAGQIASETFEQFRGGVLGSLVLSGLPLVANSKATFDEYNDIRKSAINTQSREAFKTETKEKIKNGQTHVFDEFDEKQQDKIIDNIYDNFETERKKSYEESTDETANVKESKDIAEGTQQQETDEEGERVAFTGEYRDEEGRLFVEEDKKAASEKDGKTEGRLLAGDPTRPHANEEDGNRYGYIDYEADGDTVTIKNFKMSPGRQNIAADFYEEFAEKFSGFNIKWNPKYESNIQLKTEIINNNPNGKKAGLNYFENAESVQNNRRKIQLSKEFKEWLPNWKNEQIAAGVAITQAAANAKNISLDEYINKYFQNGQIFTNEPAPEIAQQEQATGGHVIGAAEFDKDNRAIIYVTKHADFNTFTHELAHVFRKTLDQDQLDLASKAFNVKDSNNWTRKEEEIFADGFVDYLRTGKAPSTGLKAIFEKAARFIADIIRGLQGTIDISDDIRSVYDGLLKDDGSGLSEALRAVDKAQKETIDKAKSDLYLQAEEAKKAVRQQEMEQAEEGTEKETETEVKPEAEEETQEEGKEGASEETEEKTEEEAEKEETEFADKTLKESTDKVVEDTNISTDEKAKASVDEAGYKRQEKVEEELWHWDDDVDGPLFQMVNEDLMTRLERINGSNHIAILLGSLQEAKKQYEKFGSSDEKSKVYNIKANYGWERRADGKWYYETDDSLNMIQPKMRDAIIKTYLGVQKAKDNHSTYSSPLLNAPMLLKDVIDAPDLYRTIPQLRKIKIQFIADEAALRSMITRDGLKVNLAYTGTVKNEKSIIGTVTHEIQHVIQFLELAESNGIEGDDLRQIYEQVIKLQKKGLKNITEKEYEEFEKSYHDYVKDPGEREAMASAKRWYMSADERRHTPFFETEEIVKKELKEAEEKRKENKTLYQMDDTNYFKNTYADWEEQKKAPDKDPDYTSGSGSKYWYTKEGVYRESTHWGMRVASCSWLLDGKTQEAADGNKTKVGYAKWEDFVDKEAESLYNSPARWLYEYTDEGKDLEDFNEYKNELKNRLLLSLKSDENWLQETKASNKKLYDVNLDWITKNINETKRKLSLLEKLTKEDIKNYKVPEWEKKQIQGAVDRVLFQTVEDAEETGTALYTINKEAKRLRDLKRDIYNAQKYFDITKDVYEEIDKIASENNISVFWEDENEKFFIYGPYDEKIENPEEAEDKLKDAENLVSDYEYSLDDLEDDEDATEEDIKDVKDELESYRKDVEKYEQVVDDFEEVKNIIDQLMSDSNKQQNELYDLKDKVIKTLNPEIIDYHIFEHGDIRPLYKIGDFTFHGEEIEELPEGYEAKELKEISAENKLENKISVGEAKNILNNILKQSDRVLFQTAYHGSPHNFDEFSTESIGTGEGNQSFGWGLYFTNQEAIARNYAITLANKPIKLDKLIISLDSKKDYLKQKKISLKNTENVEKYNNKILKNIKYNEKELKAALKDGDKDTAKFYQDLIDISNEQLSEEHRLSVINDLNNDINKINEEIKELKKEIKEEQKKELVLEPEDRNLYTVDLPDDGYLIWDKEYKPNEIKNMKEALYNRILDSLFGGDKQAAQEEVNSIFNDSIKGESLYHNLQAELGSDKEASLFLSKLGYTGIDYPANSYAGHIEEGKRNYVIFDSRDVAVKNHLLFQIVGEKGATNLDEYYNTNERIDNLQLAKDLEKQDKDPLSIKLATGWEKGADGKWKHEVFNLELKKQKYSKSRGNNDALPGTKFLLKDIVSNKDLFIAYPELKDITVIAEELPYNLEGYYKDDPKEIVVKCNKIKYSKSNYPGTLYREMMRSKEFDEYWDKIMAASNLKETEDINEAFYKTDFGKKFKKEEDRYNKKYYNFEGIRDTLTHEIQHAIQSIENFGKGGSEKSRINYISLLDKSRSNRYREYVNYYRENEKLEAMYLVSAYEKYIEKPESFLKSGRAIPYKSFVYPKNKTERRKALLEDIQKMFDIEKDDFDELMQMDIRDMLQEPDDQLKSEIRTQQRKVDKLRDSKGVTEYLDADNKISEYKKVRDYDFYSKLSGEAESRNVERRLQLSDEERKYTLLSETTDVPNEEQIVLFQIANEIEKSDLELDDESRIGLQNLTVAKIMELQQKENEEIEKATGWTKIDNTWKYNFNADFDKELVKAYSTNKMKGISSRSLAKAILAMTKDVDKEFQEALQSAQRVLFQMVYDDDRNGESKNILFQTEKEMMDEASTFDSWEEWQSYYEFAYGDAADQAVPANADAEWYKSTWEKAKKIAEENEYSDENRDKYAGIETADEDEKDKLWYEMMKEEGNLDDFLRKIAKTIYESPWIPADAEEQKQIENKDRLTRRFDTEMRHQFWRDGALAARPTNEGETVPLNERHRKTLMTMMSRAKRDYRDIYADFMGKEEWKVAPGQTTTEQLTERMTHNYRIASPEMEFEAMTPAQRKAFADKLDFEDLKKEVKDGTLEMDPKYIQELMKKYDAEIKSLEKKIEALKKADTEHAEELVRTYGAIDNLKAELKGKYEARKQLEGVRDIKLRLIKNVNRRVDFKRISYDEGKKIIAIQELFQPLLRKFVNKFINMEGPYIRDAYSKYKTDLDYKAKMRIIAEESHSRNARRVIYLFDNVPYDKWTIEDRELVAKTLPRTDWIDELKLDEIEKKRAGSLQLDLQSEETQELLREALPPETLALLTAKDLKTWTLEEMEDLVAVVNGLFKEGTENLRAKKEVEIERAEKIREQIRKNLKSPGIEINDDDTPEEKERKRKAIDKWQKKNLPKILGQYNAVKGTLAASAQRENFLSKILNGYGDANVRRVARILDNGKDGVNTTQLFFREDDCFNREQRAVQKRTEKINKVLSDNDISLDELYKKMQVKFPDGTVQEFTVDELLYMEAANADNESRAAVACGNMFDETVKIQYRGSVKLQEEYEDMAMARFEKCLEVAKTIPENIRKLLYEIQSDYDQQYDEMNRVSIDEYNEPVWRVEHYVPLNRLESNGDENANRQKEDLLAASGSYAKTFGWVDRGMTKKRVQISPANQRPVQLGLYSTWLESMQRTEHFIAYAGYLRDLNRIYKGRDSGAIRQMMENRYGKGMVSYIDQYINETANPNALKPKTQLDRIVRALRGKTAPAYLSWKLSSIVKQFCTSPWPFMQYVSPWKYASAALQFAGNKNIRDAIKAKSAYMNSRVYDPMIDIVNEQKEKQTNKFKHGLNQFQALGMKGLEEVDWVCVAPGWLAVYKDEYARLSSDEYQNKLVAEAKKKYEEYSDVEGMDWVEAQAENARMTESDIEEAAVRKADDVTRLCQPSSRLTDLSPIFKDSNEMSKVFLQFTTSLNVIWQNLRYDLPNAVKNKQWHQVIGTIAGYTLAGIAVGLVSEGLGDEGDDDEKKAGQLAFYALSQYTDSVPVIGSMISNTVESTLTNEWKFTSSNNLFPITTKAINGIRSISKEDWDKAAENFGEAAGIATGLPVSGTKELLEVVGVNDEKKFKPEALLGRR